MDRDNPTERVTEAWALQRCIANFASPWWNGQRRLPQAASVLMKLNTWKRISSSGGRRGRSGGGGLTRSSLSPSHAVTESRGSHPKWVSPSCGEDETPAPRGRRRSCGSSATRSFSGEGDLAPPADVHRRTQWALGAPERWNWKDCPPGTGPPATLIPSRDSKKKPTVESIQRMMPWGEFLWQFELFVPREKFWNDWCVVRGRRGRRDVFADW